MWLEWYKQQAVLYKKRENQWNSKRVTHALSTIYILMLMYNNDNNACLSLGVAFNALKTVFERVKAIVEVEAAERAAEKSQKKKNCSQYSERFRIQESIKFYLPKKDYQQYSVCLYFANMAVESSQQVEDNNKVKVLV